MIVVNQRARLSAISCAVARLAGLATISFTAWISTSLALFSPTDALARRIFNTD